MLHAVLGARVSSLLYVGQTFATSTRSHRLSSATLQSRTCENHLSGNIGSSTFRKTMSAVLLEPLALQLSRPKCLDRPSNHAVSAWMRVHLRVVPAPYDDRDLLAKVDQAVLGRIDPPLNLKAMTSSPVRATLSVLRRRLG
jgi:hypothetical protein